MTAEPSLPDGLAQAGLGHDPPKGLLEFRLNPSNPGQISLVDEQRFAAAGRAASGRERGRPHTATSRRNAGTIGRAILAVSKLAARQVSEFRDHQAVSRPLSHAPTAPVTATVPAIVIFRRIGLVWRGCRPRACHQRQQDEKHGERQISVHRTSIPISTRL